MHDEVMPHVGEHIILGRLATRAVKGVDCIEQQHLVTVQNKRVNLPVEKFFSLRIDSVGGHFLMLDSYCTVLRGKILFPTYMPFLGL